MPELPEVETTRRGIEPQVAGRCVTAVQVRDGRLRWPVPAELGEVLQGQRIEAVQRRAKYLLLRTRSGTLIVHLGMSGSLRLVAADSAAGRHDHVDIILDSGIALRLRDPRRFGALLWTCGEPFEHPRLRDLGPEPLDAEQFNGNYLYARSRARRQALKNFLMDAHTVVGVGNIYASEALHVAGLRPSLAAGRVSRVRYERLAASVREVLQRAIAAGGTTLRDFVDGDGQPGYFAQQLRVYGRTHQPCPVCGTPIRQVRLGQRSSFYCPRCQK